MSPKKWILGVGLAGVLALVLVLFARVDEPSAEVPDAMAAHPAGDVRVVGPMTHELTEELRVTRTPVVAQSPSEPRATPAEVIEEPPPTDDLIAAFEALGLPKGYWTAFRSVREFIEFDLSRVRALVHERGARVNELLGAYVRVGPQSELRPMLVVASAYCQDVNVEELDKLQRLAEVDYDARTLQNGTLAPSSSYASTLALWLLDAQTELVPVAAESLSRYMDLASIENRPTRLEFLRGSAALALETADRARSAELRRNLQLAMALDAEPVSRVTEAAWRLHGRSTDKVGRTALLDQARAGLLNAHFGIREIDDGSFVNELKGAVNPVPMSESDFVLGQSACTGLLSIATERSWRAFEGVLSRGGSGSVPAQAALEDAIRPRNLAYLLDCVSRRWRPNESGTIKNALRAGIDRMYGRLARGTVPRNEVRETCRNLRSVLSELGEDDASLAVALRVLAEHGDDGDRRMATNMSRRLSDAALRQFSTSLSRAR